MCNTRMTEVEGSTETLVINYYTTWCNILEEHGMKINIVEIYKALPKAIKRLNIFALQLI